MTLPTKFRSAGLVAALLSSAAFGVTALAATTAQAQNAPTQTAPPQSAPPENAQAQDNQIPPGVSREAVDALARMNKTLQEQQFSFRAQTVRAYVGANGELLHIVQRGNVLVKRPDRLSVSWSGDDGATKLFYNGKNLVVYGVNQKQYATVPVPATLDGMLNVAEDKMGIEFPLAELMSADPEKSMLAGVTAGGKVGTADIDGVRCNHFYFEQAPDMNVELWLEDNERALPRRIFITYRTMPGRPTFIAQMSDWNFSVKPTDAEFAFQPPADVKLVELKPRYEAMAETGDKERSR